MEFNIKTKDGPARIGELKINNKKIITPNIFFIDTLRFKSPEFAKLSITNIIKNDIQKAKKIDQNNLYLNPFENNNEKLFSSFIIINNKIKEISYIINSNSKIINEDLNNNLSPIYIVANALQIFHQQTKFVDFIVKLREKIGTQKMIYIPSVGHPINFAVLCYIGIDFFDNVSAIVAARKKNLIFPYGEYNIENITEIPCSCPSCKDFKQKPSQMSYYQILNHNYLCIDNEIKNVRNAISLGNLRELVEIRIRSNPLLTSILKIIDKNHYNFMEERTPIIRNNKLIATTDDSLNRVEIKRFQERIINRYKKPSSSKILLLLPCSAKKPYSFSKSHGRIREKISKLNNPNIIHEVIITSPLGVVPRELELTYPASSYDIPVIGFWDENEKRMIQNLLKKYLKINKYDKIILYLPKNIIEFIDDFLENTIKIKTNNKLSSKESLDNLFKALEKEIISYDKVITSKRKIENLKSLASYQFGKEISNELLKDTTIKGKYPYHKIFQNKVQIGMLTKERGLISLTIDGAKKILKFNKYWVEIFDDFILKGSVFSPGINDSDDLIRIGDEVYILQRKKLCAVGVAKMNGSEMKKTNHGEAVKIRHIY